MKINFEIQPIACEYKEQSREVKVNIPGMSSTFEGSAQELLEIYKLQKLMLEEMPELTNNFLRDLINITDARETQMQDIYKRRELEVKQVKETEHDRLNKRFERHLEYHGTDNTRLALETYFGCEIKEFITAYFERLHIGQKRDFIEHLIEKYI